MHTGRKTSRAFGNAEGMLQGMPQPASSEPSHSSAGPTFAGILATLAAPGEKRPPVHDLDGFEDDLATLSYERALRVHSRFRTPDLTDRALTQPPDAIQPPFDDLFAEAAAPAIATPPAAAGNSKLEAELDARNENAAGPDRHLKSASVTVRLSKVEYAQLRMRAAEAGLTVSAYLRSCTLEAEALRAQVKDTLAQFRTETLIEMKPRESYADAASQKSSWLGRLRFWPHHGEKRPVTEI
jgi:hypothetical protein